MANTSFMLQKPPKPDPANVYGGAKPQQQNPQYSTTMGMPQQNQAQPNQQPGYQAGNVADYLKQNAIAPTGNYNPQPYGLPSYGGFQGSPVGQAGKAAYPDPPIFDWNNPASWNNQETRQQMESYLKDYYLPFQTARQNEQQNAFQNWMGIQNLGGQQNMNAFNQAITGRQTGLQEWAAQQAAQQAQAQFGLDQNLAQWRYGAGGLEQQNINNQRYATDQERIRQGMMGTQALEQIGARSQGEQALQGMIGTQQMGQIGARGTQERLTQDVINKGQAAVQELINTGNLSVQQQRDLAEMQRLQGSVNSLQFGQQQLGEQTRASKAQEALRAQQNQNELMAARYAAFGRQQAPNAQWRASWG